MRCSYCDILYGSVMIMGVFEIFWYYEITHWRV
jgi:hypothetical protein